MLPTEGPSNGDGEPSMRNILAQAEATISSWVGTNGDGGAALDYQPPPPPPPPDEPEPRSPSSGRSGGVLVTGPIGARYTGDLPLARDPNGKLSWVPLVGEKPFGCPEPSCGFKSFKRKGDFKKHLRTHTGEKPYPCKSCDKTFADASTRSRHMKSAHSQIGAKQFQCQYCPCGYTRKDNLYKHMINCHPRQTASVPIRRQDIIETEASVRDEGLSAMAVDSLMYRDGTDGRYAPVHEARAPPPPPEAAEIEPPGCELRTPGTSYEAQGSLAER